ncbi:MAG: carbohydrate kinase family protein [Acidobacteria bacterium]|nr:carbohydrate kinase family protein [Acidobacteriota bacterium]
MNGVLVTGNIVLDILTRPVEDITWGGTRWVDSITQSLGGNGANTSSAIAMLGVPARLIGAVGNDPFGDAAIARLHECGVDTSLVERLSSGTATTVALVRSDGARAFLHRPGVSRDVFSGDFQPTSAMAADCTRLHIGNPFALKNIRGKAPSILRQARELGLATSLDTAWDALDEWMTVLGPSLPHTQILFCNEDEAHKLTGSSDPTTVAARLRDRGASIIVLKLGPNGCAICTSEGEQHIPAFPVQAIDTTGAGDCFAGAFLAALQRNCPLPQAARIANAVGALNVQSIGGTSGLRSWEATLAWIG